MSDLVLEAPGIGKNFSRNNALGKRRGMDFYETPYSMTEQLLEVEHWPSTVWEPAAGGGAIVRVLRAHDFCVLATDIATTGDDFLLADGDYAEAIITNPPYRLTLDFVLKAKQVCSWKFAFLLPTDYLHGTERFQRIFQDTEFPFARVWVFTRRPMLGESLRSDGKYRTGMQTYAWFVWDKYHRGPPQIGWIDNQRYVLGDKKFKEAKEALGGGHKPGGVGGAADPGHGDATGGLFDDRQD